MAQEIDRLAAELALLEVEDQPEFPHPLHMKAKMSYLCGLVPARHQNVIHVDEHKIQVHS
jgi:hypothetical protein